MLQKRKFINYLLYLRKFWVLIYFYQLYLKFMEIFEFQFLILIFQGVSISILRNIQILLEIKITQKTLPYIIPHRFSIYVYKIVNPRQKFPIQQTNQHFHLQWKLHLKTSLNRKLNFNIYLWKIRFSRIFFYNLHSIMYVWRYLRRWKYKNSLFWWEVLWEIFF